jgi:hypothetical protein
MLQYMDLFFEVYACVLWKCIQDRNRGSFILFPEIHILFPVTLKICRFSLSYGNYCIADGVSASGAKWLSIQRNWSKFLQMRKNPWGVDAQDLTERKEEYTMTYRPTELILGFFDKFGGLCNCVPFFSHILVSCSIHILQGFLNYCSIFQRI